MKQIKKKDNQLNICPRTITKKHVWFETHGYGEEYYLFGFITRKYIEVVFKRCAACGIVDNR